MHYVYLLISSVKVIERCRHIGIFSALALATSCLAGSRLAKRSHVARGEVSSPAGMTITITAVNSVVELRMQSSTRT